MNAGRIVIFTDDPGWHGRELCRAFDLLGYCGQYTSLTECRLQIQPDALPILIPGFERQLPDAAFVRGVPGGSLEEVVFYLDILHVLELLNVPVYNSGRMIERSVDKAMTSFLLHRAGIPTPPTWVLRDAEIAKNIVEAELQQGNRVMNKPLFGSQGEGIRCLGKATDLLWIADNHGMYYLQRFIECAGEGFADYRVFVVNGRAVAMMRRRGRSWLNNVSRGAHCEAVDVDPVLADIAVKAAKTLAMDYAGVDVIQNRAGEHLVIEVNSIPAWKGLQSVVSVDIAFALAQDLVHRYLVPKTTAGLAG
jgi:tetrahydromethanopterin:alpha-L-glutamate ligase